MKKAVVILAMVGMVISLPALANVNHPRHEGRGMYHQASCRDDGRGSCREGWRHKHRMRAEDREIFAQSGVDLNSHRWQDGSPRSTLPPHNARGAERPTIDTEDGYWIRW